MPHPFPGRTLCLVGLASLGWAVSFGLLAALAPLWLSQAGLSSTAIGLNTSLYYLGVAVASPFVPAVMRRFGRGCVAAGMLVDALSTALFPFVHGALAWHALRLLGGVGTAFSLIPMETQINHDAPPGRRARDFAAYAFCVALGIALGPGLGLPLFPLAPKLTFVLGGLVTLLAIGLAWAGMPARCLADQADRPDAPVAWSRHSLGFATAWVQGFLEGGTFAFLTLFLVQRDPSEALAGVLMGALFLGVVSAQLPIGWLADRFGRLRLLLACHALLLVGLVLVPLTTGPLLSGAELFVVGAACGALYPLGLALLGERLPLSALGDANAYYLAANCLGSMMGPLVVGLAAERVGPVALFFVCGAALLLALSTALFPSAAPVPREQQQAAA